MVKVASSLSLFIVLAVGATVKAVPMASSLEAASSLDQGLSKRGDGGYPSKSFYCPGQEDDPCKKFLDQCSNVFQTQINGKGDLQAGCSWQYFSQSTYKGRYHWGYDSGGHYPVHRGGHWSSFLNDTGCWNRQDSQCQSRFPDSKVLNKFPDTQGQNKFPDSWSLGKTTNFQPDSNELLSNGKRPNKQQDSNWSSGGQGWASDSYKREVDDLSERAAPFDAIQTTPWARRCHGQSCSGGDDWDGQCRGYCQPEHQPCEGIQRKPDQDLEPVPRLVTAFCFISGEDKSDCGNEIEKWDTCDV